MATPRVTIDALPEQGIVEDTNFLIIQDDGVTKKMSVATLKNAASNATTAHITDTVDAHDATAISALPSGVGVDSDTVQGQLSQLAALIDGAASIAETDAKYVELTGDTMTGPLTLAGIPSTDAQAANKQYVDTTVAAATSDLLTETEATGLYVNVGGDSMTGPLVLPNDPANPMEAATKQYVDANAGGGGTDGITEAEADARYVNVTGDTVTGGLDVLDTLTVGGDTTLGLVVATRARSTSAPSSGDDLTRKDYVDTEVSLRLTQAQVDARVTAVGDPRYLNTAGDTATGSFDFNGGLNVGTNLVIGATPPTLATHATRKDYVDAGDKAYRSVLTDAAPARGLALTDAGNLVYFTSASAVTVLISNDATVNFPIGSRIDLIQAGTGKVTITVQAPAVMNPSTTPSLRAQWSAATLIKVAANTWVLVGDIAA